MPRKTNGATIRVVRQALGISLTSLAARAQVSKGYLSDVETGAYQPSSEVIQRLATELGVPLDAITYPVPEEVPA
jgi:transcriptional regulator with XRE-family HTH domain